MNLWVQIKYAQLVSSSLERCKTRSDGRFKLNFRCPLCGDSEKSEYKTRGWLFENNGRLHYKCFNCGRSPSFQNFLREVSPVLYDEYRMEVFKNDRKPEPVKEAVKEEPKSVAIRNATPIIELDQFHPARSYLRERRVPEAAMAHLLYVDGFFKWVNENVIPNKFSDKAMRIDEPRIVFPLKKPDGSAFGFQGRVFGESKSDRRYMTVRLAEDTPKLFGLDRFDPKKPGYVVEGPIDSLFLPNCLAMVGAEADLDKMVNRELTTIIFDNEPRSREITSMMNKYISHGWKVCIWPSSVTSKDINDMVLSGLSPREVEQIVASNTYSGLKAQLKMKFWSKI